MNITTAAKRAALRIATQHLSSRMSDGLLTEIAYEVQYAMDQRETDSTYFVMQEDAKEHHSFWDGAKWGGPPTRKVYNNFDDATAAYRKAFLACEGKVTIAHSAPGGIIKYQPL